MTPLAQEVLRLLRPGDWFCGVEFMEAGIGWSFATRISEVRRSGYPIRKQRCRRPEHHHRRRVWEYSLAEHASGDGR